jgi:hypothetical protein
LLEDSLIEPPVKRHPCRATNREFVQRNGPKAGARTSLPEHIHDKSGLAYFVQVILVTYFTQFRPRLVERETIEVCAKPFRRPRRVELDYSQCGTSVKLIRSKP